MEPDLGHASAGSLAVRPTARGLRPAPVRKEATMTRSRGTYPLQPDPGSAAGRCSAPAPPGRNRRQLRRPWPRNVSAGPWSPRGRRTRPDPAPRRGVSPSGLRVMSGGRLERKAVRRRRDRARLRGLRRGRPGHGRHGAHRLVLLVRQVHGRALLHGDPLRPDPRRPPRLDLPWWRPGFVGRALCAEAGVKPFLAGNSGLQMGGWVKREITNLEDLKGLKYRIPGLGGEVVRRLGVTAVSLPPGEILPALQSGRHRRRRVPRPLERPGAQPQQGGALLLLAGLP